jgi:hypothetical protein
MGASAPAIARRSAVLRDDPLRAIAGECREMPGMRLTRLQFGRLWHLEASQCEAVVRERIARGDLSDDASGRIGSRCDAP